MIGLFFIPKSDPDGEASTNPATLTLVQLLDAFDPLGASNLSCFAGRTFHLAAR